MPIIKEQIQHLTRFACLELSPERPNQTAPEIDFDIVFPARIVADSGDIRGAGFAVAGAIAGLPAGPWLPRKGRL